VALTRKDLGATVLTALAVVVFAAASQGWNVWLIGDSNRWAAGVIVALGVVTCGFGSPGKDTASRVLGGLGALAAILSVGAIVTGSLTVLALLTLDIVVLWAASLLRHVRHSSHAAASA